MGRLKHQAWNKQPQRRGKTSSLEKKHQSSRKPPQAHRGKAPVVVSKPESSQRQEEAGAGQQQEGNKTTDATESDDDVLEEIEGHPQDGRQHVYVCRQRGDHFIFHEEIPIEDETRKVKLAAKRLIAEVQVRCCFVHF
jgi:hypothetical protein